MYRQIAAVLTQGGRFIFDAVNRSVSAPIRSASPEEHRHFDALVDLQELRALIGRSRLFLGGDTGPLHVAAATDTPVVGLYGPTLAARSAPWRPPTIATISLEREDLPCRPCDQRTCAPGDFRCLTWTSANQVSAKPRRPAAAD